MFRVIRNWPFLSLGFVTFALFILVEVILIAVGGSALSQVFIAVSRVLIIPMWLMRYLEMLTGIHRLSFPLDIYVALPLLFAPYFAADLLVHGVRRLFKAVFSQA